MRAGGLPGIDPPPPPLSDARSAETTMISLLLIALLLGAGWAWTPDLDRATLEARHAGPPSRFVQAAGLRLHVRDTGPRDAPAVLLLHGFGASLHTWDAWATVLEADHRVIRFDLPAAGLTGADPGGDYSDARSVEVIAALMDALSLPRAHLVGHSMGGRLAWRFAAEQPARVDKLVLVAPDGFASPGFEYGKAPAVPLAVRLMPWALPRAVLRMGLAPAWADPDALSDATVDRYHDLMRAPGVRRALIERMAQTVLQEPGPWLRRIRAPVLLLWGEQDPMIPLANAADYQRELLSSKLVALPGVGHLPQEEAPEASVAAVRDFLRE
jgi:pimeloyl-ACP methyl ester carboxylesterase